MIVTDEAIARLEAKAAELEAVVAAYGEIIRSVKIRSDNEAAVLRACADLDDAQLRWYQHSGPFRHICRAEMKRRGIV